MKKAVQLFLCFLAFGQLKAQITDSIPPVDLRDYMENLLANIDQTPITSGILMEKGIVNVDFRDFDGTLSLLIIPPPMPGSARYMSSCITPISIPHKPVCLRPIHYLAFTAGTMPKRPRP